MDHLRIIKRAFNITFAYRALWIFGILLALTTSGGGGNGGSGGGSHNGSNAPQVNGGKFEWPDMPFFRDMPRSFSEVPQEVTNGMIAGGIALICLIVLLSVAFAILRYVSMVASIRMTNDYEASGVKITVRQGFRLGWSRSAFRLWLVDLLFGLASFVAVILLLAIAAAPLLLWLTNNETVGVIGTVITVGLAFLVILTMIVAFSLVGIWLQLIYRMIILEGLGVMDGIRRGWHLAVKRPGDVIIMGLLLFGISLGFGILLIPVVILLLMLAGVTGVLPGLLAGSITNIFVHETLPVVIGVIVGLPIFLAVFILPMLFVNGLMEIFKSATWTLTYRELLALNTVRIEPEPEPVLPDQELSAAE